MSDGYDDYDPLRESEADKIVREGRRAIHDKVLADGRVAVSKAEAVDANRALVERANELTRW